MAAFVCIAGILQNDEIVPVHDLDALEISGSDIARSKGRDATRKLGSVEITDPNDFAGGKISFATHDARGQQTPPTLAQGFLSSRIHEERAFGMMKKGNPALAALEPSRLVHKHSGFRLAGKDSRPNILHLS